MMESKTRNRLVATDEAVGCDALWMQRMARVLAFLSLFLLAVAASIDGVDSEVNSIRALRTVGLTVLLTAPWLWVVGLLIRSIRRRQIRTVFATALVILFAGLAVFL